MCVSIISMTLHYAQLCQTQLITLCVQYRFDDTVKDDDHGAFDPEMIKLPQETWIETFVEGVTDKSTGLNIFKELVWFVYKVSGVMCSASACEDCWSIEGYHLLPWDIEVTLDAPVDEPEEEPEV